jgi:AcrR family transcriptional regulator
MNATILKLKQRRSRERRDRIVAAATHLFGKRGIAQTSLTEVARFAGMPLPSLYDYFRDKQDLVAAVPEQNYQALYEQLTTKTAGSRRHPRAQLRDTYLANLAYIDANPDGGRVFFLEIWPSAAIGEARIRKAVDRYGLHYVGLVRGAVASGDYRRGLDPYLAMSLLMGGLCQLTAVWLLYHRPYDLVERGGQMFDLIERTFLRTKARHLRSTRGYRVRGGLP